MDSRIGIRVSPVVPLNGVVDIVKPITAWYWRR